MIVWEEHLVGERDDGTEDLFNIGFISGPMTPSPERSTLTESHDSSRVQIGPDIVTLHRYYRNIKPTITPANDYVLYFVSDGASGDTVNVPEPCLIPIVGGEPDTTQRRALMVDQRNGIFAQAGIEISENTIFQWNPTQNILGFIDKKKYLCYFDYTTESAVRITEAGKVDEFIWTSDGSQCAVVTERGISLVSVAGNVTPDILFKEISSDDFIGLSWSYDMNNPKLAFRMVRKGKTCDDSWTAIVIYSLDTGISYYASPGVSWNSQYEYADIDYRWWRTFFTDDNEGVYASMPVCGISGKRVIVYHSFVDQP
jgi:hypothetical protein